MKKKSKQHVHSQKTGGLQMQTFEGAAQAEVVDFAVLNPRSVSLRKLEQEQKTRLHAVSEPVKPQLASKRDLDGGGSGGGGGRCGSFATMLSSMSEQKLDLEGGGGGGGIGGGGEPCAAMGSAMLEHKLDLQGDSKQTAGNPMIGQQNSATNPLHQEGTKIDVGAAVQGLHQPQPTNTDPRTMTASSITHWLRSVNVPERIVLRLPEYCDGELRFFSYCFCHGQFTVLFFPQVPFYPSYSKRMT
jgi:hypothetical protein